MTFLPFVLQGSRSHEKSTCEGPIRVIVKGLVGEGVGGVGEL